MPLIHHGDPSSSAFSQQWWDEFLNQTEQLEKPAVISGAVDAQQTARLRRSVLDIIAALATTHKDKYGLRLWINGQSSGNRLIFENPPEPSETIEGWTARVFKGQKFGIILNRGEKFDEHLSAFIASRLQPLIERMGMPTEGLLFTLFIGNYDKTPLGIHKDLPGKSVVQFHLGPGSKEMYTWADGVLESRLGPSPGNIYDVEPQLAFGTRHVFGPGDIYFMPPNLYHVGRQDDLSITVGCWYNNRMDQHFAGRLLSFIETKYLRSSRVMMKADRNGPLDTRVIDPVLSLFELPRDYQDLPLHALLRSVYADFRLALFSNGGLRNAPVPAEAEVELSDNDVVALREPYQIRYRSSDDNTRLLVFSRGSMIEVNNAPGLTALIDALNEGESSSVAALRRSHGALLPVAAVEYFLRWFHETRAVSIQPARQADRIPSFRGAGGSEVCGGSAKERFVEGV